MLCNYIFFSFEKQKSKRAETKSSSNSHSTLHERLVLSIEISQDTRQHFGDSALWTWISGETKVQRNVGQLQSDGNSKILSWIFVEIAIQAKD
jgi:hypothetical protein